MLVRRSNVRVDIPEAIHHREHDPRFCVGSAFPAHGFDPLDDSSHRRLGLGVTRKLGVAGIRVGGRESSKGFESGDESFPLKASAWCDRCGPGRACPGSARLLVCGHSRGHRLAELGKAGKWHKHETTVA